MFEKPRSLISYPQSGQDGLPESIGAGPSARVGAGTLGNVALLREPIIPPVSPAREQPRLPAPALQPVDDPNFSRLPRRHAGRSYGVLISFVICVIGPALFSFIFYAGIVSHQYTSEFRFSVQEINAQLGEKSAASSMLRMFGTGASVTSIQNYLVIDYLTSSQAVQEMQRRIDVIGLYSRPEIDWWSRFTGDSVDAFVLYWRHQISANYDQVTGLAHVTVRAFTPDDAYKVGSLLVALSEELINNISTRQQADGVRLAQQEVKKAEDRLRVIQAELTELRNRSGVLDPTTNVVASNSALAQKLRENLAQLETNLAILRKQNLSPTAPAVISLRFQIKATQEQLAQLESSVGASGAGAPMSTVLGEFEKLTLERKFAQTSLTSAMELLDQARAIAATQQLYITPYVQPRAPTLASDPKVTYLVFLTSLVAMMLWAVGLMLVRVVREHYL